MRASPVGKSWLLTQQHGVSLRSVIIGVLLTPLNVLFLVKGLWLRYKVMQGVAYYGGESLFTNTVGLLFLSALFNRWLKARGSKFALRAGELLTVYLILGIGTGLTSSLWSVGGSTAIYMTHAFWFATPENRWQESVWPNLAPWLTMQDREALSGFYLGSANPYTLGVLRAWAAPALWWTCLVTVLMGVCLFLNSILRRRWAEEERLTFPLTILPVQLADESFGLFRSKLFWLGAVIALGMALTNSAAQFIPSFPHIPTMWTFASYTMYTPPWSFLRFYDLIWSPWYLGLAYLIPLDLSFSLMVFAVMWSAQYVISGHFGWCTNQWSGFPYGDEQTAGGFLALGVMTLWLDRRFLFQVLRRAIGVSSPLSAEEKEGFGYRTAVIGVVAGCGMLWWLLSRMGMPTWAVWVFLVNYFLMVMVIGRLRAQLGAPSHQLSGAMPGNLMPTLFGSQTLGPKTMGALYLLTSFLHEQQNNPAPVQLEGLKMAEGGRMERRRLVLALAGVPVLAMLSYFWATIHVGYHMGMASGETHIHQTWLGAFTTGNLAYHLNNPSGTSVSGSLAVALGFAVTCGLYALKLQLPWWPLHPVAYGLASSHVFADMMPALFATWVTKGLLLRYGGLRAHRAALPLFLGLLAGDAAAVFLRDVAFRAFMVSA